MSQKDIDDLLEAAWRGKPRRVKSLIKAGVDPFGRGQHERTALHMAILGAMSRSVEEGESVDEENEKEVVEALMSAGLRDEMDSEGCSALGVALREGLIERALDLINGGARGSEKECLGAIAMRGEDEYEGDWERIWSALPKHEGKVSRKIAEEFEGELAATAILGEERRIATALEWARASWGESRAILRAMAAEERLSKGSRLGFWNQASLEEGKRRLARWVRVSKEREEFEKGAKKASKPKGSRRI